MLDTDSTRPLDYAHASGRFEMLAEIAIDEAGLAGAPASQVAFMRQQLAVIRAELARGDV